MLKVNNGWNCQKGCLKRFKSLSEKEKEDILSKRKSDNNASTRMWAKCLCDYLTEKLCPDLKDLDNTELAAVLGNFYVEPGKKKITEQP